MPLKLLVLNNPASRYLRHLAALPETVDIVVGDSMEAFTRHVDDASAVFVGMGCTQLFREMWPALRKVRWVHSFAVGVESVLFPEFAVSPVPCTNSRGVFARSLGEFALASVLFFAKDIRRMVRQQAAAKWEQFDMEELHGKTMGVVGYGEIGRSAASRARAFGMQIIALRRKVESGGDGEVRILPPEALTELLAQSDYVLVSAPLTPQTNGMIGEAELRAMKPSAVIINVGRGPLIVEEALIAALRESRIRGAALDVFDQEPLPPDHPFWEMENVLLSPHCADHTATWLDEAMEFFVGNFRRFVAGVPLRNVVDKSAGY